MDELTEATPLSVDVETIVSVLVDTPVTAAVLYGSHARGEHTEHSDIDLAIVYDDSLSSVEKTRVRLSLIEQLSSALGTDAVDVVPLADAPHSLRRNIQTDGIVLYGSKELLSLEERDHEDRMNRFDALLADIERVV